jgi:PilZ domain
MSSQPGKATSTTPERRHRRYPRHRSEFAVVMTLFSGNQYQKLDAHCKDLSEAGIGVLLAAEVPMGEVVSLNFCLPTLTEPWEVRAVLRHRRGFHYGFEFLSLAREQSAFLRKYVEGLPRAD